MQQEYPIHYTLQATTKIYLCYTKCFETIFGIQITFIIYN